MRATGGEVHSTRVGPTRVHPVRGSPETGTNCAELCGNPGARPDQGCRLLRGHEPRRDQQAENAVETRPEEESRRHFEGRITILII